MPLPQHDGKHGADAVITPGAEAAHERETAVDDVPRSVIMLFQRGLFEHVRDDHAGAALEVGHWPYSLHRLADEPDVGVVGGFGIGAPITAAVAEDLIAYGTDRLLAAGIAGSLDPDVGPGETVVCTRAIRDEGVSHHYLEPGRWVDASEDVVASCERAASARAGPFHAGPSWTTSAPYRETRPEIEHYAAEGVLTVEMEAAALFAVARYREVDAGAVFTISDVLGPDEWEPMFDSIDADLRTLFDVARRALA